MSRRILVVEPDVAGRGLLDRLLTNEGFAPDGVRSVHDARAALEARGFNLALVDALAGTGSALEEVRWLQKNHPGLPVIVMGAVLTARVMVELVRLRVTDVLPKPFTPEEVRAALARATAELAPKHAESLEFAAALGLARRSVAAGELDAARHALSRAHSQDVFDAETMTLASLISELAGDDDDAARGYRAAIALRDSEDVILPEPYESLARLETYGDARPVPSLGARWVGVDVHLSSARGAASGAPSNGVVSPHLSATALSIAADEEGFAYAREGREKAFLLLTGPPRVETFARALLPLAPRSVTMDHDAIDPAELLRLQTLLRKKP